MAKKYFVLLDNSNNDTNLVFYSAQPRGAALKAASRGHTSIRLRERGTNLEEQRWQKSQNAPLAEQALRSPASATVRWSFVPRAAAARSQDPAA